MLVGDCAIVVDGSGGRAAGVGPDVVARGAAGAAALGVVEVALDELVPGVLELDEALEPEPPGRGGVIWNRVVPWPAETVCARSPVEGRAEAERMIIPAVAIEANARMVRIRVWPG